MFEERRARLLGDHGKKVVRLVFDRRRRIPLATRTSPQALYNILAFTDDRISWILGSLGNPDSPSSELIVIRNSLART